MSGAFFERERALTRLAARQHWVVTYRQLASLGFSRHAIDHRLRTGQLFRLYRGIYAFGRRVLSASGRRLAAVLAHGSGAVLSHASAAAQWQLLDTSQTMIDVSVPRRLTARPGIRLHFTSTLHPEDLMLLDKIPITSVERTLADLAAQRRPEQLLEAVEQAYTLRQLDLATMYRVLDAAETIVALERCGRSSMTSPRRRRRVRRSSGRCCTSLPLPTCRRRCSTWLWPACRSTCSGPTGGWWSSSTAAGSTTIHGRWSAIAGVTRFSVPPAARSCV